MFFSFYATFRYRNPKIIFTSVLKINQCFLFEITYHVVKGVDNQLLFEDHKDHKKYMGFLEYSTWFNMKYKRTGHVQDGRYYNVPVEEKCLGIEQLRKRAPDDVAKDNMYHRER